MDFHWTKREQARLDVFVADIRELTVEGAVALVVELAPLPRSGPARTPTGRPAKPIVWQVAAKEAAARMIAHLWPVKSAAELTELLGEIVGLIRLANGVRKMRFTYALYILENAARRHLETVEEVDDDFGVVVAWRERALDIVAGLVVRLDVEEALSPALARDLEQAPIGVLFSPCPPAPPPGLEMAPSQAVAICVELAAEECGPRSAEIVFAALLLAGHGAALDAASAEEPAG